jgi:hypothetical protein
MKTAPLRFSYLLLLLIPLSACVNNVQTLTLVTLADGTRGLKNAVDIGPAGPSQGDLFVFDQPLMDQGRKDIGSNSGYCVTTLPGVHSQCQWTLLFFGPGKTVIGTIVVGGQELEAGKSTVAVIGSTGKYAGFTGEMTSEPNPDGTFTQTLHLVGHLP